MAERRVSLSAPFQVDLNALHAEHHRLAACPGEHCLMKLVLDDYWRLKQPDWRDR